MEAIFDLRTNKELPYWIIKKTETCARDVMAAILVQLNKRTVAILDLTIMQKLFIWLHGGHFGLKNKETAPVLKNARLGDVMVAILV